MEKNILEIKLNGINNIVGSNIRKISQKIYYR